MGCLSICTSAVDSWTTAKQRSCPRTHSYCYDYLLLRKEEDTPVGFSFDLTLPFGLIFI